MKNTRAYSLFIAAFIFSAGILFAQNPTTIVCQGTLTDINGAFVANEECFVTFSIENADDEELFKTTSSVITTENGNFLLTIEKH